jgi:hypothetical protein
MKAPSVRFDAAPDFQDQHSRAPASQLKAEARRGKIGLKQLLGNVGLGKS